MSMLICTPMYGGMCTAAFWRSSINLSEVLNERKIPHDWLETTNESLITRGRNTSAATFLKSEYSHLFFIDADIEFEPEDVAHVWNLAQSGADVAVGCYPRKELKASYAAWVNGRLLNADQLDKVKQPYPVDYAGTGFMMIKRRVFDVLMVRHPEWKYDEGHVGEAWGFFQDPIEDGIHLSEDYFFCKRVREAGMHVMMHPKVRLKHWGTHCFDGT